MAAALIMAMSMLLAEYTSPAAPITPAVSTQVMAMATSNITGDIEAMALSHKLVAQEVSVVIEIWRAVDV